jgi:hypothetical protein
MMERVPALMEVMDILRVDGLKCGDNLNENLPDTDQEQQFWRRATVRAFFAEVEAITYELKQFAYAAREIPGIGFSPGDIEALTEETYELNERGKSTPRKAKLPTLANLRFAFDAYGRAVFSDYELDVTGQGWQFMKTAIDVRDRLTHPKGAASLLVTRKDLEAVVYASAWFRSSVINLLGPGDMSEPLRRIDQWVRE